MTDPDPTVPPAPAGVREPPEQSVDLRDVMPHMELPAPDVPPDPTLVELIADGLKADDRRATDFSWLLG